jgi:hypothetical protein
MSAVRPMHLGIFVRSIMRSFVVLVLWSLAFTAEAQRPWTMGAGFGYGFLWPHRPSAWILVEGHAPSVEVFAERSVTGARAWHHDYLMPVYGFSVLYTTMANERSIGSSVRVVPYLYLPFFRGTRSSFGMRVGWGIGYVEEAYDRIDNNKQIAIGSRLNTAIHIMPQYRMAMDRWTFTGSIGIDHWSNGSYQLPNLGLNYLTANVGVGYAITQVETGSAVALIPEEPEKLREYSLIGAFGINETGRPLSGKYSVFSLSGQVQWRVSKKSRVNAGFDIFNKGALVEDDPELQGSARVELTQAALHGGYALALGRGELFFHMGAYLYSPVPEDTPVFHRTGMRYRTGKHLIWNISLKSHYAAADHFEIGLGYRWD